jgi:putative flippase GtrA
MQFSRFLIVGVVATCLQYGCMWMLLAFEVCGPAIASSAGYGLSAIANYFLNYQFTFHSNRHHRSALSRFFGLVAFGLSCNAYLLVKLSDGFGLNIWLSQIMASFLVTFLNFALAKLWVYRSREES